ncbi:NAD(P)-binding domain-containing protein [Nocardioides sp. LMS-CY]|uniref:NAD(P)-binding domain-containing protein n=1 Tax=Nocardioides sp. (strain LMS-CY) TaxID=2840457 RepID=UPI001C00498D|nr:NAD(P)-binding domain-containing protein [Nocardioides sp. LMS-CY]QWF24481.1 NAD(P)-binding domain-containing protein [Nocardioides sp. LMS-CY]
MTTYGVLGVGSIATAIVTGLCDGVPEPPVVVLSPRNAARAADLAARFPSVRVAADNQAVVDAGDVVLVCLRPADAAGVLDGLRFRTRHAVVSAVAGLSVGRLAELVAPATDIARSIPLPAVATRDSVTPVQPATPAVTEIFDRLGGSLEVRDETAYEAVGAASATVAAYFRYLGTISGWMTERGVPGAEARRYVADTFAALSAELGTPGADFDALARAHATPGGLNEQLARDLDEAGVYAAVRAGLDAVLARTGPR